MAFSRVSFTQKITDLPDEPVADNAIQLKQAFQQPSDDIQNFINNEFLTELEGNGADNIGITPMTGKTETNLRKVVVDHENRVTGTENNQNALNSQFKSLIANAGNSNAEIVAGRTSTVTGKTFDTMGERIDDHDTQLADVATHMRYIEGLEYLISYHDKIRNKLPLNIISSGDSTTFGFGITDANFIQSTLIRNLLLKFGQPTVNSVNAGHSGMTTVSWYPNNGYLQADLAQNPDLYILRWGLNDGGYTPKEDRLAVFTNALRSGLAYARSQKTVQQMSIILMMPNSTDESGTRDKKWFDEIYPVIKKAARDFQCCFVDTYNFLLDSTNVTWQDTAGTGGTHIHPLETANAWINSLLADVLIPIAFRKYGVNNLSSLDEVKSGADLPLSYNLGVSLHRAQNQFPYDGHVITFRSADGVLLQINNSLYAENVDRIAFRRGISASGVVGAIGDNAWGSWFGIESYEPWQDLPLSNGWINLGGTNATAQCAIDKGGNVQIKGIIQSGTITAGTLIATLPIGHRPLQDRYYPVLCGGAAGFVQIKANGEILATSISSNVWVDFGSINFKAEQ